MPPSFRPGLTVVLPGFYRKSVGATPWACVTPTSGSCCYSGTTFKASVDVQQCKVSIEDILHVHEMHGLEVASMIA